MNHLARLPTQHLTRIDPWCSFGCRECFRLCSRQCDTWEWRIDIHLVRYHLCATYLDTQDRSRYSNDKPQLLLHSRLYGWCSRWYPTRRYTSTVGYNPSTHHWPICSRTTRRSIRLSQHVSLPNLRESRRCDDMSLLRCRREVQTVDFSWIHRVYRRIRSSRWHI